MFWTGLKKNLFTRWSSLKCISTFTVNFEKTPLYVCVADHTVYLKKKIIRKKIFPTFLDVSQEKVTDTKGISEPCQSESVLRIGGVSTLTLNA